MKQGRPTEKAANLPVISQADAADSCKVSERSVRTAREVIDHGTEELREAVEAGERMGGRLETRQFGVSVDRSHQGSKPATKTSEREGAR